MDALFERGKTISASPHPVFEKSENESDRSGRGEAEAQQSFASSEHPPRRPAGGDGPSAGAKKQFHTPNDANSGKKNRSGKKKNGSASRDSTGPSRVTESGRRSEKDVFSERISRKKEKHETKISRRYEQQSKIIRNSSGRSTDEVKGEILARDRRKTNLRVTLIIAAVVIIASVATLIFVDFRILILKECSVILPENSMYTENEINGVAGVFPGKTRLMPLNRKRVSDAIETALPYIGKAEIEKDYPDNLIITVSMTKELFCIEFDDGQIWIDKNGKILSDTKKKLSSGEAKVLGFESNGDVNQIGHYFKPLAVNEKKFDALMRIADGIEESGLKVSAVEFVSDELICMTYKKYIKIYANYDNDFAKKLSGVKDILKETGEIKSDYYFDIRNKGVIINNYGKLK